MPFIADLHIHSKYSRATSGDMTPENIWKWAQLKGISVVGTGDFTHPNWFKELNDKLEPLGNGLLRLRGAYQNNDIPDACRNEVSFLLTAEISCIYSKRKKTRKVHCLVFAPDFASAVKLNVALAKIGNVNSDGRPILGLDAKDLLKLVLDTSPGAMLIPAHAWTPHFSVFGAVSGFDSLEECFEELTPHIHAIETGLSSDPAMNRRLSALDKITLISNSDAHSPAKMGREANIFETDMSYDHMMKAIRTGNGFAGTIEFFPEEGKYHYDGHRNCKISLTPEETRRYDQLCPVCGKKVTIGVMHRVHELADRAEGAKPESAKPFRSIIPLQEIIAEILHIGVNSKTVNECYERMLVSLGNEFGIMIDAPLSDIKNATSEQMADAIARMRCGKVYIEPGYDGEYGKVRIFEQVTRKTIKGQELLF
ncbi:MAG TPA: endonuclease Q family protein [Dissulfurispiraceae bacterium]|nr:endonuclease Q family protein [Dissulfurispiraceae bacterium]